MLLRPRPSRRHGLLLPARRKVSFLFRTWGCDNGLVTVNGKPARASYDVKVGDQITLRFGIRTITVEVLSVQETVRQAEAGGLYREVDRRRSEESPE